MMNFGKPFNKSQTPLLGPSMYILLLLLLSSVCFAQESWAGSQVRGTSQHLGNRPANSHRFDFSPEKGNVGTGYTLVSPDSIYKVQTGFGWIDSESVSAVMRPQHDTVDQDFVQTSRAVFRLDIPDGWYEVTVRIGDEQTRGKQLILAEGREIFSGSIEAGEYTSVSQRVRITDRHLDIELFAFRDQRHTNKEAGAIINALIVSGIDMGQPTASWKVTHDGYYRLASVLESEQNNWPFGTHLVWQPTALGKIQSRVATLVIPTLEEKTHVVRLHMGSGVSLPPAYELHVSDFARPLAPEQPAHRDSADAFLVYVDDPEHPRSWLIKDKRRHGAAGFVDVGSGTYVEIESGERLWTLHGPRLPNGEVPAAENLYAIKPQDGHVPLPPPVEGINVTSTSELSFAFIGEIKWCTNHPDTWAAALASRGILVSLGYEGSTPIQMSHSLSLCNLAQSVEDAVNCAAGDTCSTNAFGNSYSFLGCKLEADCYMGRAKQTLQQARDEGFSVPRIDLAQVIHEDDLKNLVDLGTEHTHINVCGLGSLPGTIDADGNGNCVSSIDHPEGASVVAVEYSCPTGRISIHEFGHNLGALHGQSENLGFAGCEDSVMGAGTATSCSLFGTANAAVIASCVKDDFMFLSYESAGACSPLNFVESVNCPVYGGEPFFPAE